MYKTYTTDALVCGSKDSYTSDRSYLLFTKEAGMLWATAKSVREEKSKQRYALQDFSFIRVSLVKGRSGWRVGSVEAVGNPFLGARSRSERAYITGIISLLRRYIHGEQQMHELFDEVVLALKNPTVAREESEVTMQVFTLRLLYTLGYISKKTVLEPLISAPDLEKALAVFTKDHVAAVTTAIQHAHESSHL